MPKRKPRVGKVRYTLNGVGAYDIEVFVGSAGWLNLSIEPDLAMARVVRANCQRAINALIIEIVE